MALLCCMSIIHADPLEIKRDSKQSHTISMNLCLGIIGETTSELAEIAELIVKALERSGQFKVTVNVFEQVKAKKAVVSLFDQGYGLALFINLSQEAQAIEWRIYNIAQATMIKGKRMYKRGGSLEGWAYNLADELWYALTQQPSSFSSKIAYIKRKQDAIGRTSCVVCTCDYDGSHEKEISHTCRGYVGLSWHPNSDFARLFCSQFTRFNLQLISLTLEGRKKILVDLDGTCVGISLSKDGSQGIYGRSGDIWRCVFNKSTKRSLHQCVIANDGKNMSPTLLENGDILFCSDSVTLARNLKQAAGPHLYYYHSDTKQIDPITYDGYCVGPAYCPLADKIAYSKRVNGIMQLFIFDRKKHIHEQLTFDLGNKIDCSWSPCGNYLVFCYEHDKKRSIVILHVLLKKRFFITDAANECSYPAWSPTYTLYPSSATQIK